MTLKIGFYQNFLFELLELEYDSIPLADSELEFVEEAVPLLGAEEPPSREDLPEFRIRQEFPDVWLWDHSDEIKFVFTHI